MKIERVKDNVDSSEKQSWLTKDISLFPYRVKDKEKEGFYSQLALLMSSGFDLRSSLELIKNDASTKWKEVLDKVYEGVINGGLLSSELEKSNHFSAYEYESLKIGEESGSTESIFSELSVYYQRRIELKRRVVGVALYPVIVIAVGLGVVFFMLRVVVPMFQDMFKRFDSELPPLTKAVISLSDGMALALPWLGALGVIGLILHYVFKRNTGYRLVREKLIFRTPVVGAFVKRNIQSKFSQNMRLLLSANTPLVQSLDLTKNMLNNLHYQKALEEVKEKVSVGESLHVSLKETKLFQKRIISLVKVGEEVNQLDTMFDKISSQLSEELDHQSKQLGSLVEPILILSLGVIVGFILVAMYLPILNLSKILQ